MWNFWHEIVNWFWVSVAKKSKNIQARTHRHKHFACTLYKIHQDIAKELHVLRPVISRFGVGDARPMRGQCVKVLLQIGVLENACKEGLWVYLSLFCALPTQNSDFFEVGQEPDSTQNTLNVLIGIDKKQQYLCTKNRIAHKGRNNSWKSEMPFKVCTQYPELRKIHCNIQNRKFLPKNITLPPPHHCLRTKTTANGTPAAGPRGSGWRRWRAPTPRSSAPVKQRPR